jgi:hypothetical protein
VGAEAGVVAGKRGLGMAGTMVASGGSRSHVRSESESEEA